MKRIIAMLMAVLMISAVLVACGDSKETKSTVTTTVSKQYDDGYAKNYANKVSDDDKGNTVYEFTGEKYEEFVTEYAKKIGNEISSEAAKVQGEDFGQYAYVKTSEKSVIIGVNPGKYEAAAAEAAAAEYAKLGFKVFQNLEEPVSTIKVVYCNAGDQSEIYGTFEITAD